MVAPESQRHEHDLPVQLPPAVSAGVARTVAAAAVAAEFGGDAFVQTVLHGMRTLLQMDVAFVGEFSAGARIFRFVDHTPGQRPLKVGDRDPLETTYCQRIVDGRLPGAIADTSRVPEAAALPVTASLPVGAHLSIPITLSDGSVYGTFCTFSHSARRTLNARDLDVMRLLAQLIVKHLELDRADRIVLDQQVADITEIVDERRFGTVFQPIVDLRSDVVVGYEALTRFATGTPDYWFDLAGSCGLAICLEMAAVESAVASLPELPASVYLSLNVSSETLCSREFLALAERLPLGRIVLELTEQTSIADYQQLVDRVRQVRDRGARIAIDDAGAGYSGLQRILTVAPDIVKLDRQLITGIDADDVRQSLALAMSWFTTRSGNQLVAEGIETAEERQALSALGIRFGQGYALGRPAPLPVMGGPGLPAPREAAGRLHRLTPGPAVARSSERPAV